MRHILAIIFGFLLVGGIGVTPAQTPPQPVALTAIHGPRAMVLDSVLNLRATVTPSTTRPVEYLWDLGDGVSSEGVVIAHRYDEPGPYTVTLIASNAVGRDTLQTKILVTAPTQSQTAHTGAVPNENGAIPSSANASPRTVVPSQTETYASLLNRARKSLFTRPPTPPTGTGFTWILASDLERKRLQTVAVDLVLQGLRVEIYEDTTGPGSPAYRLMCGHFSDPREALTARQFLPERAEQPIMMDLSGLQ